MKDFEIDQLNTKKKATKETDNKSARKKVE